MKFLKKWGEDKRLRGFERQKRSQEALAPNETIKHSCGNVNILCLDSFPVNILVVKLSYSSIGF